MTIKMEGYVFPDVDWTPIPQHMREGLFNYIMNGVPTGSFLTAVLCNNLRDSFAHADDINRHAIYAFVKFLYNDVPSQAHGSPFRVSDWIKQGGCNLRVREIATDAN